jgi:hypothetical protein
MLQLQPTMLPQGGASLPLAIAQYYCRQNLHLLEICRRTSLAVPAMRQFAAKRVLISRSRVFTSGQFKEQEYGTNQVQMSSAGYGWGSGLKHGTRQL